VSIRPIVPVERGYGVKFTVTYRTLHDIEKEKNLTSIKNNLTDLSDTLMLKNQQKV
jgi:hypothetical protein